MKLTNKSNQRGLGTLELLLLILILIILAFIAWFIYNSSQKTKTDLDKAAAESSQSAATAPAAAKTFTFKEYGVQIPLTTELNGLAYEAKTVTGSNDKTYVALYVTTDSLKKSINACNAGKTPTASDVSFDALNKGTGTYPAKPTMDDGSLLKQFDAFFIGHSIPNGLPCITDETQNDKLHTEQTSLQKALAEAFKTATLVK